MNINSINSASHDSTFQPRPVEYTNLNTRQQNNQDTTSLSDHARMLQQQNQQNSNALVDSIDSAKTEQPSDESIRVSSTIGRQISSGNFTRQEALDVYRSIQNLL